MNHHHARLVRGFTKIRGALAAVLPRSHSKTSCASGNYASDSLSTTTLAFSEANLDFDTEREVYVGKMGKSNKFDYTNRANSGAKLGTIIGRDVDSQANKVQKDADKQAQKARKASTGSATSSSVASSEVKDAHVHVLDIKVPSKKLGDGGACAMADGLESALRKGTDEASVVLEDLNLSDNQLTTVSLARLAPIIELAKYDLKTLNLSNNHIMVVTDEQAAQWETFLHAFKGCMRLRRLDLSGNINLGAKALEILAHAHIAEDPITPMAVTGDSSVVSLADEADSTHQETPRAPIFAESLTNATFIKRRCGLRSIPFLTLNDIGLNDAGALWLSYVIEDHHYPSQLIDGLNATHADSNIKVYQQGERGLDWSERETELTRDGLHMLKKAESIRQQTMFADQVTVASYDFAANTGVEGGTEEAGSIGRRSIDRRQSRAARGDRRASVRSIHTNDGADVDLSDLESARKKLQRSIIEKHGISSVELWRAGMRLAYTSRILHRIELVSYDPKKRFPSVPPLFEYPPQSANKQDPASRPVTPLNSRSNGQRSMSNGRASTPSNQSHKQGSYAATLTANNGAVAGESELAITEVTNSPATPKMVFKPHRKEAFSDGGDLQAEAVTKKLDALIVRDYDPRRFVRYQEKRIEDAGHGAFRNGDIPSNLTHNIIELIARHTISQRLCDLLSEKQREKIEAWSVDRANFAKQSGWNKMSESAQQWMVLENIGCLEYERK